MLRLKLTTAAVIAVAAWPSAVYASTDLLSPDAREAAIAASAPQDLRSPDARDAGREAPPASPDNTVSPTRSVPSISDGFEWGAAGIGAAGMLALVSLASGTVLLTGRRRTPTT